MSTLVCRVIKDIDDYEFIHNVTLIVKIIPIINTMWIIFVGLFYITTLLYEYFYDSVIDAKMAYKKIRNKKNKK
jgi:hypothetical protein